MRYYRGIRFASDSELEQILIDINDALNHCNKQIVSLKDAWKRTELYKNQIQNVPTPATKLSMSLEAALNKIAGAKDELIRAKSNVKVL